VKPKTKTQARNRVWLWVILSLALMALILFAALPGSPVHVATGPLSVLLSPVQKAVLGAWDGISGFYASVLEGERIRAENKALREEKAELEKRLRQLEEYQRKWDELKDLLSLKEAFQDYDLVGGILLARETGTWFESFRIDVGIRDGISVTEDRTYPVVDARMNLVGRLLSSDAATSRVLPLLHEATQLSIRVDRPGGAVMRVRGDFALKHEGLLVVDRIPETASLVPGDRILTSGIGGLYPSGLPVGEIVSVDEADAYPERTAVLRPYTDFDRLGDLFVMKGKDAP